MADAMAEISHFGVVDYTIVAMVLVISLGIGVYHGFRGNKTADDFLLASQSLSPIPVACSLIASFTSTVALLGYSAEAYAYGIQMYWTMLGMTLGLVVTIHVIIPVFYGLQLKSVNEYIILRFKSPTLKYMMLIFNTISQVLLLGINLYAPLIAISVVTPISSEVYILVTGVIVTVYCSVGGMKAVVWTDVFQTIILFAGAVLIAATSISRAGGFSNVWRIARDNGRVNDLDMRVGIHERHTTFNAFMLGLTAYAYLYSFHQAAVQRFTSQKSLRSAKGVMYANLVGTIITVTVIFLGGIGIYAVYHGCDPLTLGLIQKRDQITPFYVVQHLGYLTGIPGLFVAGIYSATLSTISSILNIVPTMVWNDFLVELRYFQRASEKTKIISIKLITISLGIGMIGLAFLSTKTKGVIQAAITVSSAVSGPIAGVFVMGIAMPLVGKKGAIAGFITSICLMSWICIGAQLYGEATPMLPLHADLCDNSSVSLIQDITTPVPLSGTPVPKQYHPLWFLYNISYTYFNFLGILVCVIVGLLVTFATGREDLASVKPEHVMHILRSRVGPREAGTSEEKRTILKDIFDSKKIELQRRIPAILKRTDPSVAET